jgi:hypothetical protein
MHAKRAKHARRNVKQHVAFASPFIAGGAPSASVICAKRFKLFNELRNLLASKHAPKELLPAKPEEREDLKRGRRPA